jgi:glycosyltransferase involved in cell wall biosynthesis
MKTITLIIPCKNEGHLVIDTLKFLINQSVSFKIIIADSSDEESSILLLRKYQKIYSERIQIIRGGLPAIARNNGAKLAESDYLLFLDADIHIYDKHLVKKCLEIISKKDYDLVTCKMKTLTGEHNWVYRIFDFFQWLSSLSKPFALGGFMLFKTETFRKLNGFNEKDKIAEDYHLSSKINPRKFKILDLYVHTPNRRFSKKGVYYMIKLAWKSWINRNNDEFFQKDYNYWS